MIGFPHQSPTRLAGCSINLFGYLHEAMDLAPPVQKASSSLAREERQNRWYLTGLAETMQRHAWDPWVDKQKKLDLLVKQLTNQLL